MARMSKGDWVPCRNYAAVNSELAGVMGVVLLARHGSTGTPEAPEAVMEVTDDLVVERVVGQVRCVFVPEDENIGGFFALRIVVGIYDDNSDAVALYEDSLTSGSDANSPFVWQRYFFQTAGPGGSLDTILDPGWSAIDTRVSRRLDRSQCLLLLFQGAGIAAGADEYQVTPYLRSWVRPAKG